MSTSSAGGPREHLDRPWTEADVPDQPGKTFIVTGANSGLGFETSRVLAHRGARVVLACRDVTKGELAARRITSETPNAQCEVMPLDLARLSSVRDFADAYARSHTTLDVLVCNAGLMAIPHATTAEGFEMQFGTNHLGHFALTGLLLPLLLRSPHARVVVVSSNAHKWGRTELFDDPSFAKRPYRRWQAYAQSKLANLLFVFELDRRCRATKRALLAVGAHPGYAATALQGKGPELAGRRLEGRMMAVANAVIAQPAAAGAWPVLRAATDPTANGCDYFGPSRWGEMRGPAVLVQPAASAHDSTAAKFLWELSEQLTQVRYAALEV
jgi:NAD(P)-dependent dehydrogenase (short-subunit alcohol dehydrogenase family)